MHISDSFESLRGFCEQTRATFFLASAHCRTGSEFARTWEGVPSRQAKMKTVRVAIIFFRFIIGTPITCSIFKSSLLRLMELIPSIIVIARGGDSHLS
jgi:hypothetical protein